MENVITTARPNKHLSVKDFASKVQNVILLYRGHKDFKGDLVKGLLKNAIQRRDGSQLTIGRSYGERQTALIYHAKKGFMLVDYTDINLSTGRLIGLDQSEHVRPYVCDVVYSWSSLDINEYMLMCDCVEELNRFALGE